MSTLHVLDRLGRSDEAIEVGETARAAFLAAGEASLAARADVNVGVVRRAHGDPQAALEHFDRARPFLADDPVIAAQIDSNRAEALLDLNDFAQAETTFSSALNAFKTAGVVRAAAVVEGNLADLMSRQGRLDRALLHFEQARRYFEKDQAEGDRARVARLEAEQAEAFARAGLVPEALEAYRSAIPRLDEHGLIWEATRARTSLADALRKLGLHEQAATTLSEAAQAYKSLGHDVGYAHALIVQGELAWSRGETTQARTRFEEALQRLKERPAEAAIARHHVANAALAQGNMPEARTLIDEALATARQHNLAPLLADLLHTRARIRDAVGDSAQALSDLREAVNHIERIRGSLQAERLRAAFFGEQTLVFEDLVRGVLAEGGDESIEEAFNAVEKAKSRSLLDLAASALSADARVTEHPRGGAASALFREVAQVRAQLNALYSQVYDPAAPDRGPEALKRWQQSIGLSERKLANLEGRLATVQGFGGILAPPLKLGDVQHLLDPETALIEYFVAREKLIAFVVRDGSIHVLRDLGSMSDLDEHVNGLQFQMGRAVSWISTGAPVGDALLRDVQRELRGLFRLLMAPMTGLLRGVKALVVVPHGALHALPFHALYDGERYLIERFEVSYSPSASLLSHLGRPHTTTAELPPASEPVVLGLADAAAPYIEDEARALAKMLGAVSPLTGDRATRENLVREARGAPIIHLACHARFWPDSPLSSGLQLADGWMTVRDLYELNLDGPVVVLSGCDTGCSAVGAGDELTGLVRGFVAAGASALVMSLWTLNDDSAHKIMASAYRRWYIGTMEEKQSLVAALRRAQCDAMKESPHPVLWGPFVYVGRS
ncbi:MAG: CHAT domain-containing protein [Phycisphaerales bacterium]|nr:MAG: CHAT domain-containing protein [Phycisphaerales bacterium]